MPTPNIGVVAGLGNSGTVNDSEHVRDVDPRLFFLDADKYPLVSSLYGMGTKMERSEAGKYTLTDAKLKRTPTSNPKFEWTEDERLKFEFLLTAASTTSDTTINIPTTEDEFFVAGELVLLVNAAGSQEEARVTSVADGELTVTRNVGGTGAIALAVGDKLYKMGVYREEDSTSTSPRTTKSETLFNYAAFISEPYGLSIIQMATANYHGDPYQREKMKAFDRMKQRLEMMIWFGQRAIVNGSTNPIRSSGGVFYWLESQYTDVTIRDAGGLLTRQTWDNWLLDVFKSGSRKKVAFCSTPVLSAVNGFANNQLRPADVDLTKFGMNIKQFDCAHGTVYLVYEPLFDQVEATNGTAVILDMDCVSLRVLQGNGISLEVKAYDDIQENDRSGRKGEWTTVSGLQLATGKRHGIMKNVNTNN